MTEGTITDLGDRKSGKIRRRGIKEDLFFHSDALIGVSFEELHAGDKVTFKVTESKKGPYAVDVKRV